MVAKLTQSQRALRNKKAAADNARSLAIAKLPVAEARERLFAETGLPFDETQLWVQGARYGIEQLARQAEHRRKALSVDRAARRARTQEARAEVLSDSELGQPEWQGLEAETRVVVAREMPSPDQFTDESQLLFGLRLQRERLLLRPPGRFRELDTDLAIVVCANFFLRAHRRSLNQSNLYLSGPETALLLRSFERVAESDAGLVKRAKYLKSRAIRILESEEELSRDQPATKGIQPLLFVLSGEARKLFMPEEADPPTGTQEWGVVTAPWSFLLPGPQNESDGAS